jgi:hypothetical protein
VICVPDDRPGLPRNGHHSNGASVPPPAFTRVLSTEPDEPPLDLVAVQVDDELVNAVGTRRAGTPAVAGPAAGGVDGPMGDDRLVALLASWRAEIDAEPIPELVDLDTAVAAVMAGVDAQKLTARRTRGTRLRQLAPLAAAAAIIVATVTGVGLGSQDAVPGDTLWAVQKVVNPERAESVEAKIEVESRLQEVRSALEEGDTVTAAHKLEEIRKQIPTVRGQEGRGQLDQEQEFLEAKLADTPPGTRADLKTPAKSNPKARSTNSPAPSTSSDPASTGSSTTGPTGSGSTATESTDPAARDKAKLAPAAPQADPKSSDPVKPAPQKPESPATSAPVEPKPSPTTPGGGEGTPDKSPAPVPAPPPSSTTEGTASQGGGSGSDTTTASGSAGADVTTTATSTTT